MKTLVSCDSQAALPVCDEWLRPAFQRLPLHSGWVSSLRDIKCRCAFSVAPAGTAQTPRDASLENRANTFQVVLKPQTGDLTIKVNVEDREGTGNQLWSWENPLPSGMEPSSFVFQKRQNRQHLTHKGVYHITNKSLMATSRKGLMAAMTLHSRQLHSISFNAPWSKRHSMSQS